PAPAPPPAPASDAAFKGDELTTYYRKQNMLPPSTPVTVTAVTDSPVPGLKSGTLQVGVSPQIEEVGFVASPDGRYVVFQELIDVTVDPGVAVMKKIDLEGVQWKGPADAPVTIIEYSDFQCPFCSRGYNVIEKEVLPAYPGKVRFAYKHLPLPFHNWAEPAAIAMECIRKQDPEAAWKVYDKLFEQQGSITLETVKEKAVEFGGSTNLDRAAYDRCYDGKETAALVQAHKAEAASLGITGTPSFVVNGRLIIGAQPGAQFKAVIDDELS
ncbi:MAG: hypothetical protein FJ144_26275, partial [Deltaproteobacteria bacterium]|nr:hypothetical protein [Deltaproteobacteria bacterium]